MFDIDVVGRIEQPGWYDIIKRVYNIEGLAPCLSTMQGGHREPKIIKEVKMLTVKQATKEGSIPMVNGGVADLSFPTSKTRRGRVQDGGTIAPTLLTSTELYKINDRESEDSGEKDLFIRKVVPEECFVLQGMTVEDAKKAREIGMSDTQLYKQTGNGLVTNCVQFLIEHLYKAQYDEDYVTTDERMAEKYGEL